MVDGDGAAGGGIDRRRFLQYAGAAGAVLGADPVLARVAGASGRVPLLGPVATQVAGTPSLTTVVRRRDDLVALRFEFRNVVVDRSTTVPRLRLVEPTREGTVVVTFPPQALLEQALPFPAGVPTPGSLGARLSGPSRLAFAIPPDAVAAGIPYTVAGLLDWRRWTLQLPAAALDRPLAGGAPRVPGPPGPEQTSIEAPWWLQISPVGTATFVAATTPVSRRGRTELWHARLANPPSVIVDGQPGPGEPSEAPGPDRAIRAVWSPDPELPQLLGDISGANDGSPPEPFLASLTQRDRVSLIRLTSDGLLPGGARTRVPVEALHLSAIGATIDLGADFPAVLSGISLVQWRHRSTFGRDQYVRVVDRGYLLPFGHPCVRVAITERRFVGSGTSRSAPLERREYLVVTRPLVDFAGADAELLPTEGRQLPFRRVRLRTVVTPPVNRVALPGSGASDAACFFPVDAVTGLDVEFAATAVDRDGRSVEVRLPMLFVRGDVADEVAPMGQVRTAWNTYEHPERRWARLDGQKVAYAPSLAQRRGATSVGTSRVRFDVSDLADPSVPPRPGLLRSKPAMETAEVRLEEVEALSANALDGTRIRFDPVYLASGFDATVNAGGLFAELVEDRPLRFSRPPTQATTPGAGTDRSGGVITPDLQIRGLSRSLGVSGGDPQALRAGQFSPASFFAGPAVPRLLGGISLLDVIEAVAVPADDVAPSSALAITSRRTGDAVEALIAWTPDLKPDPAGIFDPGSTGRLRLDARVRTPLDPTDGGATSRVDGELTDVALNIPSSDYLIRIELSRLAFASRNGQEPAIDVDVRAVRFGGELAWVEGLRRYLTFGSGGPEISVLPDRVEASISVTLPNVTLGVFALRNIRFLAGLDLPLTGDPARVRFGLSSRDDPFRLTVFCIGGGGWVGIAFGADGLERLELGFEGGAEVGLDLGVASGSVSMMFGIALLLVQRPSGDEAELLGFFRLEGSVSAGPVSASITLGLELGYRQRSKASGGTLREMYGKGTIEIDLSVPLVPTPPISITYERSFRSDVNDPTFADQLTEADWGAYCGAFAGA